jgi:hypothetical protein
MGMMMGMAGSAVSAMGTIAGGEAAAAAGQAQAGMYEFKALQEEQAAAEARAAAQREAMEERREGRFAQSTLQARSAADGGMSTDTTPMMLGAELAARSEYGALMETYKGENKARGLEDQATLDRMQAQAAIAEGEAKKQASMFSAAGTLIGGFGSAFSKAGSSAGSFGFG